MPDITPTIEDEHFEFETSATLELEMSNEDHDREELLERLRFQAIELLRAVSFGTSEAEASNRETISAQAD
jgi:hypothetical protein